MLGLIIQICTSIACNATQLTILGDVATSSPSMVVLVFHPQIGTSIMQSQNEHLGQEGVCLLLPSTA
jgi:hypothetical protein